MSRDRRSGGRRSCVLQAQRGIPHDAFETSSRIAPPQISAKHSLACTYAPADLSGMRNAFS
jgi:hypothetical protein